MDVRAVDGDNRAVGVGNDRPAPHVIAARQLWRGDNRFETDRIDALHPPEWRWPGKCRHRATHVQLPGCVR